MNKFNNIIKGSLRNIKSNKLRSFLTMLGLIIGIASVIVLVGIVNGSTSSITSQVQSLGTNILTLSINTSDASLDYADMDSLLKLDNVDIVAPYKSVSSKVSYGTSSSSRASILATTPDYMEAMELTISAGRLLSEIDLENYSKVCLLGTNMVDSLFGSVNPVGKNIKIDGDNYKVIGVLTAVGSSLGNNIDDTILIPFTTAKYLGSDTSINNAYIKVENENNISSTSTLLENYISNYLSITTDDFSVSSQDSMLGTMDSITNTLSYLMAGIASISLIVGGIGVMNVMLVSVTERTKEIGIRKALGANRMDILFQFLIEALVLCLLGGIIGTVLGIALGMLLGKMGFQFEPGVTIVFISFMSSLLIGTIFGIYPANKASKLNPIDALHSN